MGRTEKIIVGLDIGSTKVSTLIAVPGESGLDPIGFGLENYDPVGSWRTHDGSFPVDSSGTLPGGKLFQGPGELKVIPPRAKGFGIDPCDGI